MIGGGESSPNQAAPLSGTAFVLAGGGSLGAIQVGMLTELIGLGVRPNMIIGVSARAFDGAWKPVITCSVI